MLTGAHDGQKGTFALGLLYFHTSCFSIVLSALPLIALPKPLAHFLSFCFLFSSFSFAFPDYASSPLSVNEIHGREALLLCLFGVSPTRPPCLMWFPISVSPLTSLPGHYNKVLDGKTMSSLSFS